MSENLDMTFERKMEAKKAIARIVAAALLTVIVIAVTLFVLIKSQAFELINHANTADSFNDYWVASDNDYARFALEAYIKEKGLIGPNLVRIDTYSDLIEFEAGYAADDLPNYNLMAQTKDDSWEVGLYEDVIIVNCKLKGHEKYEFIRLADNDSSRIVEFAKPVDGIEIIAQKNTLELYNAIVCNIVADKNNPDYNREIDQEYEIIANI